MRKMKHYFIFLLISIILISLLNINIVNAETKTITKSTVNGNYVNVRIDAGTQYPNVMHNTTKIQLSSGHQVTIIGEKKASDDYIWYNIEFLYSNVTYTGYMRSDYITTVTYELIDDSEFEQFLIEQGFPSSYWPKLKELHAMYPNWTFLALNTNLDWESVVNSQSIIGKSLISGTRDVAYRSTHPESYNWDTDTWDPKDGSSWFAAHPNAVAYYLDPRNFLNAYNILMFEALGYESEYQTKEVVQKILNGTFMSGSYTNDGESKSYADTFMEAGQISGASPIHLASRVRQEQGTTAGAAVDGKYHECYSNTYGITYKGSSIYNFFNIGAYSGPNPVCNGLAYASRSTGDRPWNSIYKSIIGGSNFIANAYINKGQNTLYLQKFNVNPNADYSLHTHQYMTNIEAPRSEASISYSTYNNYGVFNQALSFVIPVFNNMPDKTELPTLLGNPNNYLKNITINNKSIASFNRTKQTYDIYIPEITNNIIIGASKISDKAKIISGTGTKTLNDTSTKIEIIVEAGNKTTRTYTLNIIKSDDIPITIDEILTNLNWRNHNNYISGIKLNTEISTILNTIDQYTSIIDFTVKNNNGALKQSGKISTGDQIIITINEESFTQTAVLYGDVNGDGKITILDLLIVQKQLLGSKNLNAEYLTASDANKDGKISIHDLLKIQKHILGAAFIAQ